MDTPSPDSQTWTVARLLAWTRDYLGRCGVESPRLCAELLLAHAMNCERIKLYTRHDAAPDEPTRTAFRELVKQASTGHPIAYLLGRKEFFSLSFDVTPDVLIPRPETEILVGRAIEAGRGNTRAEPPFAVLDLCTGSGCIAVGVARHLPAARIVASDISPAAIEVAKRNAARHGVAERVDFRVGDLFDCLTAGEAFDLILCNPPYVAETERPSLPANVRDFEPALALFAGDDGLAVIRRVIPGAARHLRPDGRLLLEIAHNQAASVTGMFAQPTWAGTATIRDGGGHERVVSATRGLNGTMNH